MTATTDRSAVITIDGKEYELVLSTRATKRITERFDGFDRLGEKLGSEAVTDQLTDVVWLIVTLANEGQARRRFFGEQAEDLDEETVLLMTSPADIGEFQSAITAAIVAGTRREIEPEKN